MKKQHCKILNYVNVEHFLVRTSTLTLKESIVLNMLWKRSENGEFLDSVLFLEKTSGIKRKTIDKYIEKFKELKIIYSLKRKCFFYPDYEQYLDDLQELDRENEFVINSQNTYYFTYTFYHFDLAKQLELNVTEYFFLDIHIGLFQKKGYGTCPKSYTMRLLGIEERYFFEIKKQLFEKGYLEKFDESDFIKVSVSIINDFGIARDETKKHNKKVV